MHDPKHVVYEVRLPIPVRKKWRDAKHGEPRWTLGISRRTNAENVGERVYPWWNPKGYSPRVAGRAFESMRLVTIWHDEPGGADSGTVCSYAAAKRHPQHWTLQWHHWQKIRRTLFTRCEWCGGPSRTGDWVNISHQWHSPRPEHFWQSPRGVYHDDCSSIDRAHKTCLCGVGPWANGDYGKCEECGKFRAWKSKADAFHPGDEPLRLLASIPEGQRDRSKYAKASRMWRDYHEARGEVARLTDERDALAAQVARAESLAEEWRYKGQFGWGAWQLGEGPDPEGYVMDHCAFALRDALAGSEADTSEQETEHRCDRSK